jgi:hypothetical protein
LFSGKNEEQTNTPEEHRANAYRTWAGTLFGICGCKGAKEQAERNGSRFKRDKRRKIDRRLSDGTVEQMYYLVKREIWEEKRRTSART